MDIPTALEKISGGKPSVVEQLVEPVATTAVRPAAPVELDVGPDEDYPQVTVVTQVVPQQQAQKPAISEATILPVPKNKINEVTLVVGAPPPPQPEVMQLTIATKPPTSEVSEVSITTKPPPQMDIQQVPVSTVDFGPASTAIPTMVFVRKDFENIAREEEIHAEPTQFLQPIKPQVVHEGDTALFMAIVAGTEPEITWYKDHTVLEQGKDPRVTMVFNPTERTSLLTIENASPADFGNYTCEATNMAGRAKCTANLVVVRKYL